MAPGIGASGIMGIALETVSGTYVAPTKFVPFDSESLNHTQDTVWRRPIRNTPGIVGAIDGNAHIAGDITMDALADVLPYFLIAARTNVVKTGASAPFTYEFTPIPAAIPQRTLSITIVKNGVVFGFTGIVVSSFTLSTEDGIVKFNASLLGNDEAEQSVPTPTWPTSVPFGAGSYEILIGGDQTSDQVFDVDTFSFQVENNGEPQFRLKNTGRGASYIKYGEMAATVSMTRDFESRALFDEYKALTQNEMHINMSNTDGDEINIDLTTAIADDYEVSLGGQGDLVAASVNYQCVIDAAGKTYTLSVTTDEDITI